MGSPGCLRTRMAAGAQLLPAPRPGTGTRLCPRCSTGPDLTSDFRIPGGSPEPCNPAAAERPPRGGGGQEQREGGRGQGTEGGGRRRRRRRRRRGGPRWAPPPPLRPIAVRSEPRPRPSTGGSALALIISCGWGAASARGASQSAACVRRRVTGRTTKQKSLINSGRGPAAVGTERAGRGGLTCPHSPAATGGGSASGGESRRQVSSAAAARGAGSGAAAGGARGRRAGEGRRRPRARGGWRGRARGRPAGPLRVSVGREAREPGPRRRRCPPASRSPGAPDGGPRGGGARRAGESRTALPSQADSGAFNVNAGNFEGWLRNKVQGAR